MRRRVAVVMGGTESEHEISLRSGAEVIANLPLDRYEPVAALWRLDGDWEIPADSTPVGPAEALGRLREMDAAFLALHGPGGEDGRIQGFLETGGVPYTGSGVHASALAMNKAAAKTVARSLGLAVAEDAVFGSAGGGVEDAAERVGFPCVAKPVSGGSSVDLVVADDAEGLARAVADLSARWTDVLVESFVVGTEVTGPVLEDSECGEPRILPLVEIRYPGRRVFDPEAKYVPGIAEEICPAPIDEGVAALVSEAALGLHRALGCSGFSRSDFIVRDGVPVYLETNTIPGLTRESLLPKAAHAAGITMARMLDALVRGAFRRRTR